MKIRRLLIIAFFLILPSEVLAFKVSEHMLGNGLKVVIIEEHKAPVATFQIWYRSGSKYDPSGKSGQSHLLEHMMYKGTGKYSTQMFSRIVQGNGGTDNAYTTEDYTVYFEILPSDRVMLAIGLEADRMKNLILAPKEVESEKKVVMEERRLEHEDDPQTSLFEEVVALAFKVHPYREPVIGWMSGVSSIETDDLVEFYQTHYTTENAFVIVAGDVRTGDIVERLQAVFGGIPAGPLKKHQVFSEPEQCGEKRVYLKREAELPYILVAYHVPNYPDRDSFSLAVLDTILSGGRSSRLLQHLVNDKQVAFHVDSEYDGFKAHPYLFFIDATVYPGKKINEVEEAIHAEIEQLKKEPLSEKELEKAKNQIEASFLIDQDTIETLAETYGVFEMLGGWKLAEEYLEGIKRVTPDDIRTVVRRYLREDNRTVGILLPLKAQD